MKKSGLIGQLYRSYLLIIVLAFVIATVLASETLKNFHHEQTFTDLVFKANLMENDVEDCLENDPSGIDALSKELGMKSGARITIILPNGKVVGDSYENPVAMESHSDRPEIIAALARKTGRSIRYSYTLKADLLYVAQALEKSSRIIGVLRVSMPLNSVDKALRTIYFRFAVGGLIVALLAALTSYIVSRRLSRPLNDLKEGAGRFAAGDLSFRLPMPDSDEIASLADAMNKMAVKLGEGMQSLVEQRNFLDAILASMVEGVIAVNKDQKIINMNRAAVELFDIPPPKQIQSVLEVIRNTDINRFVEKTLSNAEPVEGEITISGDRDILLHAHGSPLRDSKGKQIGAVIVLNNITKLRRLESVRRDFVANVSHELRTPITSIKGFVETLQNGAMGNPEDAERFLGIIVKQSDRLNAIIEDLLSLSRIEQEAEKNEITLEKGAIRSVLDAAVHASDVKAAEKNIRIEVICDGNILAMINAPLLEQAVINLLDNAIKYSEPDGNITVSGTEIGTEVIISVTDFGCGIEKEHLPRLFERFYRVDKARSRKLGGTGLGLAIVKHIALAHKGAVEVESTAGKGSTFRIRLLK